MAWIGSDGKEGKEGKEDCSRLAGFAATGLRANLSTTPQNLPIQRRFFKVSLTGIGQVQPATQQASDEYWEQAAAMGLVDAVSSVQSGDTTFVVVAADQNEAQQLIQADPIVQSGVVGNITYQQV